MVMVRSDGSVVEESEYAIRSALSACGCSESEIVAAIAREKSNAQAARKHPEFFGALHRARDVNAMQMQNDENDRFRREYRAEPAYAKSMTEAEYIRMRRIDEGLAWCDPRQAGGSETATTAAATLARTRRELGPQKSYHCGSEHFLS